jgi:hypothetical protein
MSTDRYAKPATNTKQTKSPSLLRVVSFTVIRHLAYSPSSKFDVTYSSETSIDFQRATQRYVT